MGQARTPLPAGFFFLSASTARRWLTLLAALVALAGGCAACGSTEESTGHELDQILAGDHRSPVLRARDPYLHPKETLLFFGLRPEMRVLEAWPADAGYTEVIAPLLKAHGRYYVAQLPADPSSLFVTNLLARFREKLASRPDIYGGVELTTLGPGDEPPAPPQSIDLAVSLGGLHNWMAQGWAPAALAAVHRALKPGGLLGVIDNRAGPGAQDPRARSGYVSEDYAVSLIEAAGFELIARSEVNANPRDTKDYPEGVWTLPPVFRLADRERARYAAIGEPDRFTLKFRRK